MVAAAVTSGSRPLTRLACPELVGRDQELAVIAERTSAAAGGAASTVLISGEAGLGKSALLSRAVAIARHAGIRALRADCVRLEMRRAFGPFVDLLRGVPDATPAVRAALMAAPAADGGPGEMGAAGDRYVAHAAFARAFSELAEERPVMLAIDDLHWADDASLELFAYLSRRLSRHTLLIGAFRSEEAAARPAARHALADLQRDRLWELPLRPLDAEQVSRALRLTLGTGSRVSGTSRKLLQERCAGNPLFLEEVLRALAHRGDIAYHEGSWQLGTVANVPLPRSVADAVRDRFERLDGGTRPTLLCAAVIGERFDLELLERVCDDGASVTSAVRDGVSAQLVLEDPGHGVDHFAFTHPLVRDAVLSSALERERRHLHARIARAMEVRSQDRDELGALAYHWDEAGDRAKAFDLHRRAAEQDRARMAYAEALRHFERALELAPDDDRAVADLVTRVAEMCGVLGPATRVAECLDRARTLYERLGDRQRTGFALLTSQAVGQRTTWTETQRSDATESAYAVLAPLGDTPELCWAQAVRALLAADRGDLEAALAFALDGVAIGERCGATWQLAVAYHRVGLVRFHMGDAEGALEALRTSVVKAEGVPGSGIRMDVFTLSGLHEALRRTPGAEEEAAAVNARLRELAERYGAGVGEARSDHTNVGRLHRLFYVPEWDEYVRLHDDYVAENDLVTFDAAHLHTHRVFIEAARSGAAALAELDRVLPLMTRRRHAVGSFVHVAETMLVAGENARALELLEETSEAVARPSPLGPVVGDAAICGMVAARANGDDEAARRWIARVDWGTLAWPLSTNASRVHAQRLALAERSLDSSEADASIRELGALIRERRLDR